MVEDNVSMQTEVKKIKQQQQQNPQMLCLIQF